MHIPPYYKKRTWQSFFLGILFGAIIGYMFFLFIYGQHTERWIEENMEVRERLSQLQQENSLLKQDKEDLSERNEERLTVQDIDVSFENEEELQLDRFTIHELTRRVEEEVRTLIGRNIASISEQRDLFLRSIENRIFTVRDINYSLNITHMTIAPTLVITMTIHIEATADESLSE